MRILEVDVFVGALIGGGIFLVVLAILIVRRSRRFRTNVERVERAMAEGAKSVKPKG